MTALVADLWTIDVDGVPGPEADELTSLLSAEERARAARLRRPRDQRRFRIRRGALRCVLASYLGQSPRSVTLAVGSRGRPEVPGTDLGFSVSHGDGTTLVAVAENARIGVDVERVRRLPDLEAMTDLVCSEREREVLASIPSGDRDRVFLELWTVKEAVLKAYGVGLSADPRQVEVELNPAAAGVRYADRELAGWTVHVGPHPAAPDALVALAVTAVDARMNWRPALEFAEGIDVPL